jgi:hypothetical protein
MWNLSTDVSIIYNKFKVSLSEILDYLFDNDYIYNKRAMMALRSLTCIKAPEAGPV